MQGKQQLIALNLIISRSNFHRQICLLDWWSTEIFGKMFQNYQHAKQPDKKTSTQLLPGIGLRSVPRNNVVDKILFSMPSTETRKHLHRLLSTAYKYISLSLKAFVVVLHGKHVRCTVILTDYIASTIEMLFIEIRSRAGGPCLGEEENKA